MISVIIPTYNARELLAGCLRSCLEQEYVDYEVIINDDPRSTCDNEGLVEEMRARGMDVTYLRENLARAQGRRDAAVHARGEIMLHLDTDMEVTPRLFAECVEMVESGYDALVIPEESFGPTFWGRCRRLERQCYEGVERMEALRCVTSSVYRELGGHHPQMVYFEDKDLDLRVRSKGCKVGRTQSKILHNEGNLRLRDLMLKRAEYASNAVIAADYYPDEIRWLGNVRNRYMLFFNRRELFLADPLVGVGTLIMKTLEFSVGALSYFRARRTRSRRR